MAKISYCLVFTLVLLPLYSVLCQENAWQSVLSQATQSGISQDSLDAAKQALGGGSVQQAAQDALGEANGSLGDWVQELDDVTGESSQPPEAAETPTDLPDDEEEDNLLEAPESSPTEAPTISASKSAPKQKAPTSAPTISATKSARKQKAPTSAPSAAPQANSPYGATLKP